MSNAYDAVVIGAGHNGLVTAGYLAKGGLRVLVLERREIAGGATVTEEFAGQFGFDTGAHRVGRLHPKVAKDVKALTGAALAIVRSDPAVFSPMLDGDYLLLWRELQKSQDAVRKFSQKDADKLPAFLDLISKAARFLESLYRDRPTDVLSKKSGDIWELVGMGRRLRKLGKRDMMEVLRILPMTARELLDEWFETDVLKGTLGAQGITGIFQGPMGAGTAYMLLHQHVGAAKGVLRSTEFVRGGMGNLAKALERFAGGSGAEIRTEAAVEQILAQDGRATGVVLAGGEEITASRVISSADPKRTFLQLLNPAHLDPSFVRAVRNIKFKGTCAKVLLALDELPRFACLPAGEEHLGGVISISRSLEYLERAYDDAKHGDFSKEPYLEVVVPTVTDSSLAPFGKHIMSVLVQYAPYRLEEGEWDSAKRTALGDRVVETLVQYAPNLGSAIVHREVLSPTDLEQRFALTEGNIYHGEMTLDQLYFMRPVPGWGRYRTPIEGLYLCGAGTHPGGGVTGTPGYNAARQVLADAKQKK